ncbi:hypothetical protein OROGR_027020 [Orobanche gracilis]
MDHTTKIVYMLATPQPIKEGSEDRSWKYFKAHPKVKSLRGKSYRYYHDWVEIFGKDRAIGKNAQGPEDLAKAANQEPYIPYFDPNEFPHILTENVQNEFQSHASEHVHNDIHHDVVHIEEEVADNPSPGECNSGNAKKRDGGNKSQSRMKRSRLETNSKEPIIVNLMEEFFKQQNQFIGTFVDKLDRRDEDSENNKPIDKTKLVLEALSKICSLTEENRLYFAYKIATDASVMDLFLNFSEGERITFVNMMLAGKVL